MSVSSAFSGVCLVAFAGEEPALRVSLGDLASCAAGNTLILGSDDTALADLAEEAGYRFLPALARDCDPARYWCAVSEALREMSGAWLVVRAGTRVPALWERRWAGADSRCFALFPLSLRHPCTAVLADVEVDTELDIRQIDQWLNAYLSGRRWDIPVFAGQTAWIQPALLPPGVCADDLQLAAALRNAGAVLLASDNILIDDRQLQPMALPETLHTAWQQAVHHRHPLAAVRHALAELAERREAPPASVPEVGPAVLHISHSWGGGLGRWIDDYTAADNQAVSYILRPIGDWSGFGQTLALYAADNPGFPLRTWTLAQPILSSAIAHGEYADLLRAVVEDCHIEAIIVSSLIGHSLEVLRTALPTLVVAHDFYPFCPPILASWGQPCTSCDSARLSACLQQNPGHRFFLHEEEGHWQALRRAFIAELSRQSLQLVVPSESVAERMRSLVPTLSQRAVPVIPHGLPQSLLESMPMVEVAAATGRKLRIVVLGSLDTHKGAALLRESLPGLQALAEIYLLGCGEGGSAFVDQPGVHVVGAYQREALGRLFADIRPDLGLLLSIVPETFSYTLSELQAAAIPVVATRLGAFRDRIAEGETGWLIEPEPAALTDCVRGLAAAPERLIAANKMLRGLARRSAREMVADYRALLPLADGPVFRPLLAGAHARTESNLLRVNPEASFGQALREFWLYTIGKLENTDRFPCWARRLLLSAMKTLGR